MSDMTLFEHAERGHYGPPRPNIECVRDYRGHWLSGKWSVVYRFRTSESAPEWVGESEARKFQQKYGDAFCCFDWIGWAKNG